MDRATLGILIMAVAVLVFAGIGILYSLRRIHGVEDFITARNLIGWRGAFGSLIASGVGAWVLFSPAETGTFGGLIGLIGYGLGAAAPLVAFAFLGPRMRHIMPQGHSLTEYIWHRYGNVTYVLGLAIILFYMFIFLSAEMTGIALAVHLVIEAPLALTAIVVGVATVAYTVAGGIKASIFTDAIQAWIVIPLLALLLVAATALLGGPGQVLNDVAAREPVLLDLGHVPGLEFAAAVIIAILAANMFHQGYWQRVYACRDSVTLRAAFLAAALVVAPLIFIPGLFGLIAVGMGPVEHPSTALFSVALQVLPDWLLFVLLVLAVALVMSSVDTLINGVASLVATDLARLNVGLSSGQLLRWARATTVILPVPAVVLAAQGYSVLYLFLVADMVCAAALFPIFYGMYSKRISGGAAAVSIGVGLVLGTLFFPATDFGPGLLAPPLVESPLLASFVGALVGSAATSLLFDAAARRTAAKGYDFARLQEVHSLG